MLQLLLMLLLLKLLFPRISLPGLLGRVALGTMILLLLGSLFL